jgi:hypothetical protein
MVDATGANTALGGVAARQLANVPQMPGITPRWLTIC